MNLDYLDFEQPIAELQEKIDELRRVGTSQDLNLSEEVAKLEEKSAALTRQIFTELTASQVMKLAERFSIPVLTLMDTPGAYPGVGAEERNQSEAIARNLLEMSRLKTPIICTVFGEGCSGGALAIGVGDRTLMLQYAYYSVISPEGCASILWKSADRAPD